MNKQATIEKQTTMTGVHHQFLRRWSPRAFSKKQIRLDVLSRIVEAARWTPSCYNEQPWKIYTSNAHNFGAYVQLLDEFNQQWASHASVLGFMVADSTFQKNGKVNNYASFDCGAAWMAMALQALHENVYMRAMGGIHKKAVSDYLGLPEHQHVMIGFAMGYQEEERLLHDLDDTENSSHRKQLSDIWIRK